MMSNNERPSTISRIRIQGGEKDPDLIEIEELNKKDLTFEELKSAITKYEGLAENKGDNIKSRIRSFIGELRKKMSQSNEGE